MLVLHEAMSVPERPLKKCELKWFVENICEVIERRYKLYWCRTDVILLWVKIPQLCNVVLL